MSDQKPNPKKPHPRLPFVAWAAMDPDDPLDDFLPAIFSTRRGAFIYRGMYAYPIVKVLISEVPKEKKL